MDYHLLKRKQLQELCKKHGIPANLKSADMANRLSSLLSTEEKAENVGVDENDNGDSKEEKKEEKLEKAVRRGKSCLKDVSDVVESKEVKRVKFSPENQMFLFEKTDPRAMRLLGRKKRAFVESSEEENPVVVCGDSVESRSLGVVLDDVGRVGRRKVRRKSVAVSGVGGLVGENVNGENLQRNLRSRGGKAKQESAEVVSLVSPSGVDVVEGRNLRSSRRSMVVQPENLDLVTENAEQVEKPPVRRGVMDRNLRSRGGEAEQKSIEVGLLASPCGVNELENVERRRNPRRSMAVQALGFVTENADKVEKLPVKIGVVEQNLKSRKGKSKQESTEAVLLMSPRVVNKESAEAVLKGPNLRRNLRRSMVVRVEDLELATENADEVENLPSKRGVMDQNLRSRTGKAKQDNTEVVSLMSPCAVSKAEDVLKGPNLKRNSRRSMFVRAEDLGLATENADEVKKLPAKREILTRNLRSRAGKADQETVVSLLPPSGNENVGKPVEGGVLKRSLRPRGGKSEENGAAVVPSLSGHVETKLKKGRKGKETVEEGGADEMVVDGGNGAIDCKNPKKRGRQRKSLMAVEKVKPINDTSISKGEEYQECPTEDVVETHIQHSLETTLENKSKNRSCRKTSALKRQDFNEYSTEKPDAVKADNFLGGSTADNIASESTQPEEDGSCQAAIGFFPVEQKTECLSEVLPFSASGEEKIIVNEIVKSAEPIVQILANDNTSTPLTQSATDIEFNKVQEIPSELLALADYTSQEENTTFSVNNHSPSLRSTEAQYDNSTSELLEQANSCKDSKSSLQPLLSEDAIFNTVEGRVLESKRDDNTEDLQEKPISQSEQLTVHTSVSEQVVDNEHQTVDSTAACNLSVSLKPEEDEPYHATGDLIQKDQTMEHVKDVIEFSPSSSLDPNLAHEATQSGDCYEEKGATEKTSEKAQPNSSTPAKDNALSPVMQKSNYDKLTDEHREQTSNCRTFESSLKHLFLEDSILNTTSSNVPTSDKVEYAEEPNLAHEASQLGECYEEKGAIEKTSEKAQLNSSTPAKDNALTPVMQKSNYDKLTDEHREQTNNFRTFESSVKHLFSEDSRLNTNKSDVPKSAKDVYPEELHDIKTIMPVAVANFDANDEVMAVKLVNEGLEAKEFSQCTMDISSNKDTKEFASGGSTTECSPSDRKETTVAEPYHATGGSIQMTQSVLNVEEVTQFTPCGSLQLNSSHESTQSKECDEEKGNTKKTSPTTQLHLTPAKISNSPPLRSGDVLHGKSTDEHRDQTSNCRTFESSLKHLFSEDYILTTDKSDVPKFEKDDYAEELQDTKTITPLAAANFDANDELMTVKLVNEGSETKECSQCTIEIGSDKYPKEFASGGPKTECSPSDRKETIVAEPYHATVDSIQTTPSVENVEKVTQFSLSGSLQLNLSRESTQSKECGEEKDNTKKTSPTAQLNHLTPAKIGNFRPLRSMEVQYDMSTDEHMGHTSNCRTYESSLKHLFAGDYILNTDESKGTHSEKDDFAEDLQDKMSVRLVPKTKLDALLCEQVADDEEHLSTDCSPSDRKETIVPDVNDAVDISSASQALGENCQALNADKDQPFGFLTELDGKMMESKTFEGNEDLVEATDSVNDTGDTMLGVSALIEDKVTTKLTEQEKISRSMRECDSVSKGIDCGKQPNEFSSIEKEVVLSERPDECEEQSPITWKKSSLQDMETVTLLQDGDGACRSKAPTSEFSLSAKTSFTLLPKVVEASGAVDCSSMSHTVEANREALIAGEEQLFSSMSELGDRMIEHETFDGTEGHVKAPDSVNEMDDTVPDAATLFDHKFSVHVTEQVARATRECDVISGESSVAKPAFENSVEDKVLLPSAVEESENTETDTLLQDVEEDCISKNSIPETDLAAETSLFLQPKVFGELAPISGLLEKGEETSKETTSEDISCSKNSSCLDNLALVDRQSALKLPEEADDSIELNAVHIVAEDLLINVDGERASVTDMALTATEHDAAALENTGLSVSSQDSKPSEMDFHFSGNDCSADLNSLFTELDVMPQAAEPVPCMPEKETGDEFDVLFDHYLPQACDNLKHVQDEVKSAELVEMHHQVTSEGFLHHMNDDIADENQADFFGEGIILGNCVAFIAEDVALDMGESHSSGRIETNAAEIEKIVGGEDFKEPDVMHHENALEVDSETKQCPEADSLITDSKIITQQNNNENRVDDRTHTVQDDACTITNRHLVSQQTDYIENLHHATSEASDDGTYISDEKLLNSEAMKHYNTDEDSIGAQNLMAVDATDDDNTKSMHRSLLIHGTPRKPVLPLHDMKENMVAPKRSQMVNATTTKSIIKRKALGDI